MLKAGIMRLIMMQIKNQPAAWQEGRKEDLLGRIKQISHGDGTIRSRMGDFEGRWHGDYFTARRVAVWA
jgi:hypothetical protein